MSDTPLVSVVIPHFNGPEILDRCLTALHASTYPALEILLVDNASHDGSAAAAAERFASPRLRLVRLAENRGFAGGCNAGVLEARGRYVALLNNDAVVSPRWLEPLVALGEEGPRVAAVQPKVRSLDRPAYFDYAAAAGGLIDVLGIPFARGRIFYTCEADTGQYDAVHEVFWASGTCCLLRREAWRRVGELDESFFAHMEEIDLNWRFHLAGLRVLFCPQAVVQHNAGAVGTERGAILAGRRRAQAVRVVSDAQVMARMYRESVVWDYFVRGRRTCGALGL